MRRYSAALREPPAPGSVVVDRNGAERGEVVRAEPAPGGVELLAVVDHAATADELQAATAPLRELPLPYVVPAE
jgi:hypothetical protein